MISKTEIFYFTGTGNSLAVAKDIAQALTARLTPAASLLKQEEIEPEAGILGFVFPIYDFKAPQTVQQLLPKIKNLRSKYIFAVCTYGIAPYKSLQHFNRLLEASGGSLAAGFAVRMPHNAIGAGDISAEECAGDYRNWQTKLETVCRYIAENRRGNIDSTTLLSSLGQTRFIRGLPELLIFLRQLIFKGTESLALTAKGHCNGCGICQRICPVENIELIDRQPSWGDGCASCFACIHWCPQRAVKIGELKLNIKTYHHPSVQLAEMFRLEIKEVHTDENCNCL